MKRVAITAREDWQSKVEAEGLLWSTTENGPYWSEAMEQPVYYQLSQGEQLDLETAGNTLQHLCFTAVDWLVNAATTVEKQHWYSAYGLTEEQIHLVEASWEADEWAVYGRFDFVMTKEGPKLLEYNADTPTTLLESSVTQWRWFDDMSGHLPDNANQFNSIHEALVQHWADMRMENKLPQLVHFSSTDVLDDTSTVTYMADCALDAGLDVVVESIDKMIRLEDYSDYFVDQHGEDIQAIFKLYPWEWLFEDEGGNSIISKKTRWIEPAWKLLLSNKVLLALLWHLYPANQYLVPAFLTPEECYEMSGRYWVTKPKLSREGQNVTIWKLSADGFNTVVEKSAGEYKDGIGDCIYQKYIEWVDYDNCYPMLGVWMVGSDAVGLGIREDDTCITKNNSRFIPHIFV